ncbi:MAG: serine hydrolase domain-containing protein [Myxococcota bacterium]
MADFRNLLVAAALTLGPAAGCSADAPEDSAPVEAAAEPEAAIEPLPEHLDGQISDYLAQFGRNWPSFRFHGVVLVARGGDIGVHRAFGSADLQSEVPNETTTRFRIGTMSAQFTATAIMALADLGKLSLSDPLAKFIPDYPRADAITIEHLLTHSSGIPNFTEAQSFGALNHTPKTTDALIASFRGAPLEHEPGAETTPSNSNYVLLAGVVEAVTGKPFEQYVAQRVLVPAEMKATDFGTTEYQQATGLQFNEKEHLDPVRSVHPGSFGAAGGYLSTAEDLFKFNRALAGGTLLTQASRDKMMGRFESEIGYAWVTQVSRGRTISGWPGLIDGLNCSVLNVAQDETTVIVLANTEVVSAGQVAQDIVTMIYGGDPPTYDEHREVPVPLVEQVNAAGHYTITRKTERQVEAIDPERLDSLAEIDIVLEGDHLMLEIPVHGRKRMHPLGNGRFFFKDLPRTTAQYTLRSDGRGKLVLSQPGGAELSFVRKATPPAKRLATR